MFTTNDKFDKTSSELYLNDTLSNFIISSFSNNSSSKTSLIPSSSFILGVQLRTSFILDADAEALVNVTNKFATTISASKT